MGSRCIRLMACVSFALMGAGCVADPSYSELKKELNAVRYQYQLERLYVAGLKVQNRQLNEQRYELQVRLESVPSRNGP
jgi:hypothetical protein